MKKKNLKTIEDISIDYFGLDEENMIVFKDPASGQVDLTITGPSETIKEISSDDFKLSINVDGLTLGEHELNIEISGPEGIEWQLEKTSVLVTIAENES